MALNLIIRSHHFLFFLIHLVSNIKAFGNTILKIIHKRSSQSYENGWRFRREILSPVIIDGQLCFFF